MRRDSDRMREEIALLKASRSGKIDIDIEWQLLTPQGIQENS